MNLEDNIKEIERAEKLNEEYEKKRQKSIAKLLFKMKIKWLIYKIKGDI